MGNIWKDGILGVVTGDDLSFRIRLIPRIQEVLML